MRYADTPLLSVIVPVYNVEPYLEECLNSILQQTYENLEIILIDDGSTDRSPLICDKYGRLDSRVSVIHQENQGLVGVRKKGISIATGSIVTFVDSDDWIDKDMYEIMVKRMIKAESDVVTSGLYREYGTYRVCDIEPFEDRDYTGHELDCTIKKRMIETDLFFQSNISIHLYNKLFDRKILLRNVMALPENISVGDDAACIYPCILESKKLSVISRSFYHYRIRNNSTMGLANDSEITKLTNLYQYLLERFKKFPADLELEKQLQLLTVYLLLVTCPGKLASKDTAPLFYYPKIKKDSKIIIYGSGRAGTALMNILQNCKEYTVVSWVDKNNENSIKDCFTKEYDQIIIAVYVYATYREILENLLELGVPKEKIAKIDLNLITDMSEILDVS